MKKNLSTAFYLLLFAAGTVRAQTNSISSATFGAIEARQIGPAVMGGRVAAIDALDSDPKTIYVGSAAGGVWKTTTGGTFFKPVFDKYTQSIGDIRIDQRHPDTVWVGTGESNMRNSVSYGDGLYVTFDGGANWRKMGLDSTEHISKIAIDPSNSSVIYVAAPGPLWSDSKSRGLYKSTDCGKTWQKILYTNEKTGCADVAIDPSNPNVIYASMWQFRRTPWSFASGGPGSALYKSSDAGKTWKKIQNGFTAGDLGRVVIAVSPSSPQNVYAIVESKKSGLYLSNDGGETWKEQSTTANVTARPFYFSVLKVDPENPKRIYRPAFTLSISDDGGYSFKEASAAGGWVHSDHHALWINPNNTNQLYLGTDGGVYMSLDKGNNWIFLNTLPLAQYYHVAFDGADPYNVYGGLQDNGSWKGPSASSGGINNNDWTPLGFGDGFWVQPDRKMTDYVYWEYQGGNIFRRNMKTNEQKDIAPYPMPGEAKLRWNWNSPLYFSPSNKLYAGSQFLYVTSNQGDTWTKISPDLTTNNPEKQKQEESGGVTVDNSSAENHCTIFTVAESPLDENQVWVGTDDGNLQLSSDAGKSWTNTVKNITGLPANTWVSSIEPSRFDKMICYATFDGHATGDMNSYVYKTNDGGKTWMRLGPEGLKGAAHKVKEDLVNRNLLFVGTETGLFVSIDGGKSWAQMTGNIPNTPVRDIAIHPVKHDLILATHGRGILIVDDITPIRSLNTEVLNAEATILPSAPQHVSLSAYDGAYPTTAGDFSAANPTEDAVIAYYLKDRVVTGAVKIEIYDAAGKLMTTIDGTKRKGINRVTWPMRMKPPRAAIGAQIEGNSTIGPLVEEGTYTVKLIKGDKSFSGNIVLQADPNSIHSAADRAVQKKMVRDLYAMIEELAFMNQQLIDLNDSVAKMKPMAKDKKLVQSMGVLSDSLVAARKSLVATKEGTAITGEERLRERMGSLYGSIMSFEGKPTDSQLDRFKGLQYDMDLAHRRMDNIYATQLSKVNASLKKSGFHELMPLSREAFDKSSDQ
ncbi:MAG: hypothetical protein K1X61_00045 [Chitinophagales bacterium]|nr:hypothetical protein [Chitinophagales bacterium]